MIIPTIGYTGSRNKYDFEWTPSGQDLTITNFGREGKGRLHLFNEFVRLPTVQTKYFGYISGVAGDPPPNFDSRILVVNPTSSPVSSRFWYLGADITEKLKEVQKNSPETPAGLKGIIAGYNLGNSSYETGSTPSFIHEVCHGLRDEGYQNYNFYQSFYPYGNIHSPWGHLFTNTTIFGEFKTKASPDGEGEKIDPTLPKKLSESKPLRAIKQVAPQLTSTEYHQLFGINAVKCPKGKGCNTSAPTQITYPYYECPKNKDSSPQFAEAEIAWIPGSLSTEGGKLHAKIGGGFYNNNPIPSFFDSHFYVSSPDFCEPQRRLINAYNNFSCPAYLFERGLGAMRGSNGLLPDYVQNVNDQFFRANWVDGLGAGTQVINESFWFWHFIYKENAENFPFDEFNSQIADGDWYWKHRNCPEYPSSLPWSFGGGVFAYPESFFEVPYYSSLGKFGFYGTRFLNGKGTLLSKVDANTYPGCGEKTNPLSYSKGSNNTFDTYDKLLTIAKNQELYSNFYINNRGLIIALNYETVIKSYDWTGENGGFSLQGIKSGYKACYDFYTGKLGYAGHSKGLKGFWLDLNRVPNASELINGTSANFSFSNINNIDPLSGLYKLEKDLLSNAIYQKYITPYLGPSSSVSNANNRFSNYVVDEKRYENDVQYSIDEGFYSGLNERQLAALRARAYTSNLIDNPIDLFPLNKIVYSSESISGFIKDADEASKGVLINGFNSSFNSVPSVGRFYFYGAYANQKDSSYLTTGNGAMGDNMLSDSFRKDENNYGYGGLFPKNQYITTDLFKPDYLVKQFPISGWVTSPGDTYSESRLSNIQEKNFGESATAFFLGYNGVGKLKGNYSCFSPIFVQQPTNIVCKVGQAPQLRCLAVDYHTIPEDKMKGGRWPEINYWVDKLKLNSESFYEDDLVNGNTIRNEQSGIINDQFFRGYKKSKKKLLYPLGYKWGRIKKDSVYSFNIGALSGVEWSNSTGSWCCAEGDKETCTIIHPFECIPPLTGSTIKLTPGEAYPNMEFIQGVKKEPWLDHLGQTQYADKDYYYFCLTSGRFGMRRSEKAELVIDDVLKFDVSFKNPSSYSFKPSLVFTAPDGTKIKIPGKNDVVNYFGFQPNELAIREEVLSDRRTPNHVGCLPSWKPCCSNAKLRTLGTNGYSSWNVTWSPPAILDIPVLKSIYGYVLQFGGIINFEKTLTQKEGELLYGTYPLPQVSNGNFIGNYKGIQMDLELGEGLMVSHWSVDESAWATDNSKEGIPFKAGSNDIVSALYPPSEGVKWQKYPTDTAEQRYGKGHWQYSNNLGLIKKLGSNDLDNISEKVNQDEITSSIDGSVVLRFSYALKNKEKLLKDIKQSLTNVPCGAAGWKPGSLGRQMAYFVEGFGTFYELCGDKKKDFVKNLSYAAPGIRVGNAGFQYSFLGQPNSSYLTRESLYGPYAYMWKFNRHNRDRNGNGMPLGMYAYSSNGPYSMMYDLPSVYGLYAFDASKTKSKNRNRKNIETIKDIKRIIWEENQASPIKFEFNSTDDEYGTRWCGIPLGSIAWRCEGDAPKKTEDGLPFNDTPTWFCKYTDYASSLANSPDLSIYTCTDEQLSNNTCFHPCLSLRYEQGILPGGKSLDFFGVGHNPPGTNKNSLNKQADKISSYAGYDYDEDRNGKMVLGPISTPWADTLAGLVGRSKRHTNYLSIDPQHGGGCDHCNYVTPTAWLGTTQKIYGNTNYFKNLLDVFMM